MWRYLTLLAAGIFLTFAIAGRDHGQTRFGLQMEPIHAPLPKRASGAPPATESVAANAPAMADLVPVAAPAQPEPRPALPVAETVVPAPAAAPAVVAAAEPVEEAPPPPPSPVFSLADIQPAAPEAEATPAVQPDTQPAPSSAVRWVSANAINVREGPGTSYGVAGRLTRGEAVAVVADAGDGWVRIRIEGDGLEGFVAARLLTEQAP